MARFPKITTVAQASETAERAELRREDVMEVHARIAAKLRDQIGRPETTNQIGKEKMIGQEKAVRQIKIEAITSDCVSTPSYNKFTFPFLAARHLFAWGLRGRFPHWVAWKKLNWMAESADVNTPSNCWCSVYEAEKNPVTPLSKEFCSRERRVMFERDVSWPGNWNDPPSRQ